MTSSPLPRTPVGEQAAWVLERFGGVLRKREIVEHFTPAFLSNVSAIKIKAVSLAMRSERPFSVRSVEGNERELVVGIDGTSSAMTLRIAVDAAPPHRINGLLMRPDGPTIADALAEAEPSGDVQALLAEHLGAFADGLRKAGAAVGVLTPTGRTLTTFGDVPVDGIFEIGSITKAATATLLAEMVTAGEVSLDDPVERYVPAETTVPSDASGPITLKELATHTSGLPRLPVNLAPADEADPYAGYTIDSLFDGLASTTLAGRGTPAYTNLGYALLGQVLARAAGEPFWDVLHRRVLAPYGMQDAVPRSADRGDRAVQGHARGKPVPPWTGDAVEPAGAIVTTVADVLAFVETHLTAQDATAAALTQQRHAPWREGRSMGLGWVIEEAAHGDVHWHNGGTGGFRSFTGFHRPSGCAIAVLANSADCEADVPAARVLGALIAANGR